MSQYWMRRSESPWKVAPKTIDRGVRAIMQIMIELPEDIAEGLESKWNDLACAALESLALEAYRSHALTAAPCFRDADRGRRFPQKARNLRLLGHGFRTGSRDSSGAANERGSVLRSASRC